MTKIRIFWDAQGPYQGGFVTDEWAGSPDCFFMADEGEVYVPEAAPQWQPSETGDWIATQMIVTKHYEGGKLVGYSLTDFDGKTVALPAPPAT